MLEALEIPRVVTFIFLGEGAYGKVFKCFNSTTKEVGAVKVFEDDYEMQVELDNIQHLSNIDPDEANIIKYIEHFIFEKYHCIVYEILDCSLLDLAMNRPGTLSPSEMRPVAQQLLVAFKALKEAQIVHGDLKPDNIMLVNHQEQPFKVKLIDFGCGGFISDLEQGMDMMCDGYRAPEVTLGAPLSKALEMWSLGCCLGEGFLGCQLFSDVSFYDHLRTIIHLLGQPSDEIFKSPIEYQATNWKKPEVSECELDQFSNLEEVFLDFLKNLLHVDPEKRLTVGQALRHPFITMEHLINSDSEYVQSANDLMAVTLKTSNRAEGDPDQDPQSSAASLESPQSSLAFGDVSSPPEDHHMSSEPEESDWSYSPVTETDIDSFMGNDDVSFIIQPLEENNLCMDTNVTDPDLLWDEGPVLFWFEMDQSDEVSSCLNEKDTAEPEQAEVVVGDSSQEADNANSGVHKSTSV
uniref:Protein kinase domain-containing protein n=1 Tax=Periophthalmus magnuspinnatus TaxID=409849 RepID=A0A3B3ZKL1_9GOBI